MRKKIAAFLIAMLLIFTIIPNTIGFAEENSPSTLTSDTTKSDVTEQTSAQENTESTESTETTTKPLKNQRDISYAARVGEKTYETLSEAVQAIIDSSDQTGTIQIMNDIAQENGIKIPSGVNITLEDNGTPHTITNIGKNALFIVEKNASFAIDGNLTLTLNTNNEKALIACHGSFTLKNATLDYHGYQTNIDLGYNQTKDEAAVVLVSGPKAKFTMYSGVIQNAKLTTNTGGVRICDNGTFEMNGGTIRNFDAGGSLHTGAVFVYGGTGTWGNGTADFIMNGGVIENNKGYRGAGVDVYGNHKDYRASMTMNGGTIQNNEVTGWIDDGGTSFSAGGAGIFIEMNASVTMNNGIIQNNTVYSGEGGGVCIVDSWKEFEEAFINAGIDIDLDRYSQLYPAAFTMNDGTIENNKAIISSQGNGDNGCGGGIYVASNQVTLNGGKIQNNTASRQGGGVYVGCIPYVLHIKDALITENSADLLGGGIWACPTGEVEICATNGVAVYDNKTESPQNDNAGDDIVSIKKPDSIYTLTLADRILGGGQVLWCQDGGITDESTSGLGMPDPSVSHYDSQNPKQFTNIKNSSKTYALKAVVSQNAKSLAQENAKLIIQKNHSYRGGGIGTNGSIVMGEKDQDYSLTVTKKWEQGTPDSKKKAVTVYLKVGDIKLDPITLNSENNWKAVFNELPNPDSIKDGMQYAVVEDPVPENFTPVYSELTYDRENKNMSIEITNLACTTATTENTTTTTTENTTTITNKKTETKNQTKQTTKKTSHTKTPRTRDNANVKLWIFILVLSSCLFVMVAAKKQK